MTQGDIVIKDNAKKIREVKEGILAGFAGTLADCITIIEQLEAMIDKYPKH